MNEATLRWAYTVEATELDWNDILLLRASGINNKIYRRLSVYSTDASCMIAGYEMFHAAMGSTDLPASADLSASNMLSTCPFLARRSVEPPMCTVSGEFEWC